MNGFRQETGEKPNTARVQLISSSQFISYNNRIFEGVRQNEFVHPKLEKLRDFLIDHFRIITAVDRERRVIVFSPYR